MSKEMRSFYPIFLDPLLRGALAEDVGRAGDVTTDAVVPADLETEASIVARQTGCVAGLAAALEVFRLLDASLECSPEVSDGDLVLPGQPLVRIRGRARPILTGERTALNLLGHLSGIATATRQVVDELEGLATRVACTRKTTPGLRTLEKHAVRMGGGLNHRFGLDDAVLIKDNHLALSGSLAEAVMAVRRNVGHLVKVEVEVDTLEQLKAVLGLPVDAVLLDNMNLEELAASVELVDGRLLTEASGGITLETVRAVAATGVDLISVGWLTHSAPALDLGLDMRRSATG